MDPVKPLGAPSPQTRPLVKWPGGKSGELGVIHARMPAKTSRLVEPFVGGGAMLFSMPPSMPAVAGDMSADLVDLYQGLARADPVLHSCVAGIDRAWRALDGIAVPEVVQAGADMDVCRAVEAACRPLDVLDPGLATMACRGIATALARKRAVLVRLDAAGEVVRSRTGLLRSALKSALYYALRHHANTCPRGPRRTAAFWFVREFCYGGMFRSNAAGACNVPYGGVSYDARGMAGRLEQALSAPVRARLAATSFHHSDFATLLRDARPGGNDLVFLDPPYDSAFSTYDNNSFGRADHARLALAMRGLQCPWMLVIAATPFVRETYCTLPGVVVEQFDRGYRANIKQRFERGVTHLVATNYAPAGRPGAQVPV